MARLAALFDELEKPDQVTESQDFSPDLQSSFAARFAPAAPQPIVQAAPAGDPVETRRQSVLQKQQENLTKAEDSGVLGDILAKGRSSMHAISADVSLGETLMKARFTGDDSGVEEAVKFRTAVQEYDAQVREHSTGPLGGKLLPDTVSFMAQMGKQWFDSKEGAAAGAVAGSVIPGAGTVGGAVVGFNAENAKNWYMQGAGSMYSRFVDQGIDKEVARNGALTAAVPYAAIEFLSGYLPFLKGLTSFKPVANAALGKFALSAGKAWLARGVAETSEESLQQWLEEGSTNFLAELSNEFKGTDAEGVTLTEGWQAGVEAFNQSFLPIMMGGVGFGGVETGQALNKSLKLRSEQQGDQATTVNTDAPSRLSASSQEQIAAHDTPEQQAIRDAAVQEDMRKVQSGAFSNDNASFLSVEGESPVVDIDTVELDEAQRDRAKFNRVLGEQLFGKPIVFVNSDKLNGLFTNDAIYLTPESGIETLFHEEGHGISRWAMQQDVHKQTITDTIDFFKAKEEYWSTFAKAMKKQGVTLEELDEETVAMVFAQILSNQEAVTEMLNTNPSLFKRIVALVQDFFKSVGSVTADLVGKAPAEFANPDIKASGREGLDAFSDASLREVFGDDYDVMRKRLLDTTKAFIKSTKESSPESTAAAEEFVAAVEGAEAVEPVTEPEVTEPEIEAAPTDSVDSAALSRKVKEEDPERTVTLFRGEHGAVAGDAQRSAHYEWWTTSQKYAESYSGGQFIEVTPEGDKRRAAKGARIRREDIKVGTVLDLMGQTIYTKASFIAKLKAEGIDIDPNDVPDSKGRAVEFFKQDTRTGKLGDAIAAAGFDSVAQTESKNTPVVIVFKKEAAFAARTVQEEQRIKKQLPDTRMVARDGVPIRVYHGTNESRKAEFGNKGFGRAGSKLNFIQDRPVDDRITEPTVGAYFTTNLSDINAQYTGEQGSIIPAYLDIRNPKINIVGHNFGFISPERAASLQKQGHDALVALLPDPDLQAQGLRKVRADIEANGFDPATIHEIVVFDNDKIIPAFTDNPAAARTPQEERRDELKTIIRDFYKAKAPKDQEHLVEDRAQASLDKIIEFGKAQVESIRRGLGARAGRLAQAYLDDSKAEAPALARKAPQREDIDFLKLVNDKYGLLLGKSDITPSVVNHIRYAARKSLKRTLSAQEAENEWAEAIKRVGPDILAEGDVVSTGYNESGQYDWSGRQPDVDENVTAVVERAGVYVTGGGRKRPIKRAVLSIKTTTETPAASRKPVEIPETPKAFASPLSADMKKRWIKDISAKLKTLGVANGKFDQQAEAMPDSVLRVLHEVIASGKVPLIKKYPFVAAIIDRSIELKYIPKVFKREVTQIRKGEELKEERKAARKTAKLEKDLLAKKQQFTKGETIRVSGGGKGTRLVEYIREDNDFWYGVGGIKHSKAQFSKSEKAPEITYATSGQGGTNRTVVFQVPLKDAHQSADGTMLIGTPTETVKLPRRTVVKGKVARFPARQGWSAEDELITFHSPTQADKDWVIEVLIDPKSEKFRAKRFTTQLAAGKSGDIDFAAVFNALQKEIPGILKDPSLAKGIVGERLAAMRMPQLIAEAERTILKGRRRSILREGESLSDLSEVSLRYRLAVSIQIHSRLAGAFKSEAAKQIAEREAGVSERAEGTSLTDFVEAHEAEIDARLAASEPTIAAEEPIVTQEPAVPIPASERKSRPLTPVHEGILDAFQTAGLVSQSGGKWRLGKGGLEAINGFVENLYGADSEKAQVINDQVRSALESVGLIEIPLASRRPIRVPEVNAQAQQRGYTGYEAVSKLGAEKLIVEAKKLLREGITHDKALFTDLVLNAMADKFTDDSLKTPIKNPKAGVAAMRELGQAYLGFKSASAGTISIGKADMGSTNTIWFERWRDSIGMGAGAFQLETLQSFVKNKGGFPGVASRKAMSPIHRELTRVRAEEMSKRLKKLLDDKYQQKFGANQKGRKAAEDAWASIVSEIGRPQDNLEALSMEGSEYIQKLQMMMEFHMASKSDKALEWWKSAGLLSGVSTILQNPISNAVRQMYEYGPKKIVVDTLQGKNPVQTIGEMMVTSRMWHRFAQNAWQVATQSFNNEYPLIRWGEFGSKLDPGTVRHAIRGPKGRIIRLPYRMLTGGDEYFKMLDIQMNLAQHYYGSMSNGIDPISGDKITAKQPPLAEIEEFVEKVITSGFTAQDGLYAAAVQRALENTWQNENRFAKPFATARSAIPGHAGEYIMPFVNTPMNIFTQSLRMSPLGIVNLGRQAIKNKINRLNNKEIAKYVDFKNDTFARDVGEQVIAWGALMALLPYVRDDDDDEEKRPSITGSNPSFKLEPGRGGFMRQETMPPLNIRIGDKMFDYSRIEPIATVLPIIIDNLRTYQKIQKGEKAGKALAEAYAALGVAATDKTFLGSIHDLVLAVENPDNIGRFASNFTASWVPNIVRQTMRLTDPYARDLMPKGERFSKEWLVSFAKNTGYTMAPSPTIARDLLPPPRYDYWGQPVSKTNAQQPSSDFMYRLASLSGIKVKTDKGQKLNMMIHNWNQRERFAIDPRSEKLKNPRIFGAKYFFRPARYLEVGKGRDGKAINHYLTNEEYEEYIRTSGSIALEQAEKATFNYEHPSIRDINRLSSIMDMARRIARNRIKKKIRRQS